jgi:RNA polymerase sigma factor (sigma-70 family)
MCYMQMAQRDHAARSLDLDGLAAACQRETERFRRDQASDPLFCLEIFRRALAHSGGVYLDEPARELLTMIYTEHIRANISRRAFPNAPGDDLVQQAWMRFWQAAAGGQLEFLSLEAALRYLRMVTVSAVIEARKLAWRHERERTLADFVAADGQEDAGEEAWRRESALRSTSSDEPFDALQRARFRERCREVITDPLAYQVFWMRYSMGLPPREIAAQLAGSGTLIRGRAATARAVSDLVEQSMGRLATDREIRDLLQAD